MNSFMDLQEIDECIESQIRMLNAAIAELDDSWNHSLIVQEWCENTISQLHKLKTQKKTFSDNVGLVGKKTEKYTTWVEVMRLAFFQYSRFTEKRDARSEGLYSTLSALALTWGGKNICKIIVPGCGPGRSVLDFSRIYPDAEVIGMDYSALALSLGEKIVSGNGKVSLLQRDIFAGTDISKEYTVDGFSRGNTSFGLINLITNDIPKCDMVVCSNTINLLPDHANAIRKIANSLRSGGTIIFADLIGWRLDRQRGQRMLCDDSSIRNLFESNDIETLDMFSGVPYIEKESDDQETKYNEHFYVGRKK